jgi:integrase
MATCRTGPRVVVVVSERGSVHPYRGTWTEPDPSNGKRRLRQATTWNWRFEYHGKRHTGGAAYRTRGEAREAGEKRKHEVLAGLEEDPRKATFAVVSRLVTAASILQAPTTQASTLSVLNRLRSFFQEDRLVDLRWERVLEYVAHQRVEGYQDNTIRLDLRHLKLGMTLAHEQGLVNIVPRFPKIPTVHRDQTIPPHELDAIVSQLPEHWVRYYLIADEIGWRARSELRSRKWTDVDMREPGWVHLDAAHSKTRKARSFPMTGRLREFLTAQRAWVDAVQVKAGTIVPWVFCTSEGGKMPDPRKAWASACARAGFGKLEGRTGPWSSAKCPHDIRRTVLRRWDALGAPLSVRMAAAGHDSAKTHAGYIGGDPESLQAFAERLDEARAVQAEKVTAIRKG